MHARVTHIVAVGEADRPLSQPQVAPRDGGGHHVGLEVNLTNGYDIDHVAFDWRDDHLVVTVTAVCASDLAFMSAAIHQIVAEIDGLHDDLEPGDIEVVMDWR